MDQPLDENPNLVADDNAMLKDVSLLLQRSKKPRQKPESEEKEDQEMEDC
jgi:hypothetical protein